MNGKDPKKTYDLGMLPEIEISTSKDGKVKGVKAPIFRPTKELRPVNNNSTPLKNKFAGAIGSFAGENVAGMARAAAETAAMKAAAAATEKALERNTKKSAPAIQKAWGMYKNKRPITTMSGQSIGKDGRSLYNMEGGPRKGDKIIGKHLKFDGSGFVEDLDYKVQLHKKGKDGNIYKTVD